jgi:hypothetical protein
LPRHDLIAGIFNTLLLTTPNSPRDNKHGVTAVIVA